jgi:hypothetical protein
MDGIDQRVELQIPPHPSRGLKVGTYPLAQIPGLADVYDRPEPVLHQVDARLMRQLPDFLSNLFRRGHIVQSKAVPARFKNPAYQTSQSHFDRV